MTTLAEIQIGCGRTTGHGESCVTAQLCDACNERMSSYMLHTNLTSAVLMLRSNKQLWKPTTNRKVQRLQNALDALCSFIEDEA